MEWISVKDDLPKINGISRDVLVWVISRKACFVGNRFTNRHRSKAYHWRISDVGGSFMLDPEHVSHWAKLPEPPKET